MKHKGVALAIGAVGMAGVATVVALVTGGKVKRPGGSFVPEPGEEDAEPPFVGSGEPEWTEEPGGIAGTGPSHAPTGTPPAATPNLLPAELYQRVVAAAMHNDPAEMRALADELDRLGFSAQAAALRKAASDIEAYQRGVPAPPPPPVLAPSPSSSRPPPTITIPPVTVTASKPSPARVPSPAPAPSHGPAIPSSAPAPSRSPRLLKLVTPHLVGPDVGEWQLQLRADGHPVRVDNDFGALTDAATKDWQVDRGLSPDGDVGPDTRAAVGQAPQLGRRLLRDGSTGGAVVVWQALLQHAGFLKQAPSGTFDAQTKAATQAFQRAHPTTGTPDGIVGPKTVAAATQTGLAAPAIAHVTGWLPTSPLPGVIPEMEPAETVAPERALAAKVVHSAMARGGVPSVELVAELQRNHRLNPSGIYGPSTATVIARLGIVPPSPQHYPTKGAAKALREYQRVLRLQIAADPNRRDQWTRALEESARKAKS